MIEENETIGSGGWTWKRVFSIAPGVIEVETYFQKTLYTTSALCDHRVLCERKFYSSRKGAKAQRKS